ncbi:PAS domain-containing sensor histidine kinase [Colwelliaceae bacterium BS250]
MNWVNSMWQLLFKKNKQQLGDGPTKLALLVCIPCFTICAVSLYLAQISAYLIAFILIILLLLCSYVVVASKQNSEYQVRTLSNLIESLIDGDYTLRGRLQTNQAFQELLNLVNNLADTLAKHKIEAKQSRLLLERIMEQMDAMVLATDEKGFVVMANASANKLIMGDVDNITDIELATLPIGAEIVKSPAGIIDFDQSQLSGEHFLFKESFLSEGQTHQLYLLTNAERLLMEKERKAWQSLLRVLSHEMNNSLTPIATISQSMQDKLQKNSEQLNSASLLAGISIINERADSLSTFIASYSQLSHLPLPNKSSFAFNTMIDNLAPLFPEGKIISDESCDIVVNADKSQFEQVLINLFKNGFEAMTAVDDKIINVKCYQQGKWQHLAIIDHGTGIANADNLFVPFYTTKNQGSGIGLALCKQILFNHNGLIKLKNTSLHSGVEALLSLPKLD